MIEGHFHQLAPERREVIQNVGIFNITNNLDSNGELKRRPRLREQRALDGLKCPIIQSIIGVDEVENSGKNVQSGHSPKSCPSLV